MCVKCSLNVGNEQKPFQHTTQLMYTTLLMPVDLWGVMGDLWCVRGNLWHVMFVMGWVGFHSMVRPSPFPSHLHIRNKPPPSQLLANRRYQLYKQCLVPLATRTQFTDHIDEQQTADLPINLSPLTVAHSS